ncbi:MAG: VCBS repeat-containing protein [Acidobacteria bacterium]|nr:VCBS repeat-containing protein [Acidobacteriota bacterium]
MLAGIFLAAFLFGVDAAGQRVRLRSQITPSCPQVRSTTGWKFADIYADGNIAVQGSYGCNGAFIYDLTNPDAPVLASWYNPGNNQQFLEAIVIGNRGYFGSGTGNGGVHIVDLSNPYSPVLLGTVDSAHGNGHNIIHEMMVFNQGNATYLVENYNLLSSSQKIIKFIDITNPAAPVAKWDLNPTDVTWVHAFHIRGNRFYTSGWGGKVEIYDISNLASQAPTLLGAIAGNTTNHSTWTSEDGNYLYSCRETLDGDLRVYDVRNPTQPLLVRSIKAGDLGINAVTPHNPVVMGNKLYVSWYQAGVQVFDITNPSDPKRIGQYDTFQRAFAPTEEEKQALLNDSPWDMMCASPSFQNALPSSYDGDWAVYPFLGENKVLAGDLTSGLLVLDVTQVAAAAKNTVSDFDGDKKSDFSVYTPASGTWSVEKSSDSSFSQINFGLAGDLLVTGDYDGDGKSDYAVFRPGSGTWYILGSSTGFRANQFGVSGDVPVAADYDADGKTDIAVFRPSTNVWYIAQSTLGIRIQQWGSAGDKALTGDYEGDGKADIAVFRPSTGVWYILPSSSSIPIIAQWGVSTDKPVAGDFDGDGKYDLAVYRPSEGNWYILNTFTGSLAVYRFGLSTDSPIPADYDGDGKTDIAVFRASGNVWYRLNSSDAAFSARQFGQTGDLPSPSSVQPQ